MYFFTLETIIGMPLSASASFITKQEQMNNPVFQSLKPVNHELQISMNEIYVCFLLFIFYFFLHGLLEIVNKDKLKLAFDFP